MWTRYRDQELLAFVLDIFSDGRSHRIDEFDIDHDQYYFFDFLDCLHYLRSVNIIVYDNGLLSMS